MKKKKIYEISIVRAAAVLPVAPYDWGIVLHEDGDVKAFDTMLDVSMIGEGEAYGSIEEVYKAFQEYIEGQGYLLRENLLLLQTLFYVLQQGKGEVKHAIIRN